MNLEIKKYPDPILLKKAEKIKDPMDEKIQRLIFDMTETLHSNNNGIGLAAPQVGIGLRLCIIELEGTRYVLINPKITAKSKNKETCEEGCLSFPGEFYPVARFHEVQVRYDDESGKSKKIKARGLLARAFQHEIDHLDGIVFINRIKKSSKKCPIKKETK
ncbi:MAG TPA: peptide deformylase [Candidatus Moranbacteria bacterium]|nr:peptide deformylase [Candidatus Moranbacteria bacterium]HRZ33871.1 peptide deformylase [Candidatus Moranbacteria bacterium]